LRCGAAKCSAENSSENTESEAGSVIPAARSIGPGQARMALLHRLAEDLQAGDHGARRDQVVVQRARMEGGDAVDAAKVERAVGRAQRRGVEVGALDGAVGGVVVAPAAADRIEARDIAGGADPDLAVQVFQHGRHRVVAHAVAAGVALEARGAVAADHHLVQADRGADPQGARMVFQQVVDLVVAEARGVVRIVAEVAELAGRAVEQVEAVEGADPQPALAVFQHRPHDVVGQAGAHRRIVLVGVSLPLAGSSRCRPPRVAIHSTPSRVTIRLRT
jgi:hypothetical protein